MSNTDLCNQPALPSQQVHMTCKHRQVYNGSNRNSLRPRTLFAGGSYKE